MTEFVDEFIDKFDDLVYLTLSRMEASDKRYPEAVRVVGYSAYDISNSIDQAVRNKIGHESLESLSVRALMRLEKLGSVASRTSQYGEVWRTTQVLDAMAMLPRPHHADD